jgi:hypothetical protein
LEKAFVSGRETIPAMPQNKASYAMSRLAHPKQRCAMEKIMTVMGVSTKIGPIKAKSVLSEKGFA